MKKLIIFILFISLSLFVYNSSRLRFESKNQKNFIDLLKWRTTSNPGFWPQNISMQTLEKLPEMPTDFQIIYINHSSFLLRSSKYNILFDPIFSELASPVSFTGPKRIHPPTLDFDLLPHIDYVLISHNHYDHMDLKTLKRLYQKFNPIFLVGTNSAEYLKSKITNSLQVFDLAWGESFKDTDLMITFEEAQHWSKRGLFDRNYMLWGSFVVNLDGKKIYHAGDTGYGDHFSNVFNKHGVFDFAMLPIGDYKPEWFMKISHMNPKEAFQAFKDLQAKNGFAMHFGTFQLADNSYQEVQDFFHAESLKNPNLNFKLPVSQFIYDF